MNQPQTPGTHGDDTSSAELEAVPFSYQNVAYTVDLDPREAAAFDGALAPFIAVARRVGGRRSA